jgi:uncharacterized repeat protein (TIGR03803 family)
VGRLNWGKSAYALFLLCATTAIALPAQTFTTRHSFDGTDGAAPAAALVQDTDGNLYGTTAADGTYGDGTVFKVTRSGRLTTLYNFCSETGCTDGDGPTAALLQDSDGNLYGTTAGGGTHGDGTVFKITRWGMLTTLHSFDGYSTDGAYPVAALVRDTDGNLYGTTYFGGANTCNGYGCGTVFKITRSGTLTTLHSFDGTDGAYPIAALVQDTDGNFYGTTQKGGAKGDGTVFKVTRSDTLTTLYNFCSESGCKDGALPWAALVQDTDGNFYGTTAGGGAKGDGTVFKVTRSGRLTTLHSFEGTDGQWPTAALVQGTDGNFYGTTPIGGANGDGTVFKVTRSGRLTTLHSFDSTDGAAPVAALVRDTDGNLYGTTVLGGADSYGTVFCLSPMRR